MAFGGFLIILAILSLPPLLCSGFPSVMKLERAFPINQIVNVTHLVERDEHRHGRMLTSSRGVINYTLSGTSDLFVGLYYTRIQIGTPPADFYVEFDTGSDLTWVGCISCVDCPMWTGLPNTSLPRLYNPASSFSYSSITCMDKHCPTRAAGRDSSCNWADNDSCRYSVVYPDKTRTSGTYVLDVLNYDRIVGTSRIAKSTPFVFGCSNVATDFQPEAQVDGILGFGRQKLSVISQLAARGKTPNAFSHCLRGDDHGGGVLVLGELLAPNIIYTPMIPSQPHYVVDLQRMTVNGQVLPIDPSMLSATQPGARVDSGMTLSYLGSQVFDSFMTAIYPSTSALLLPSSSSVDPCYRVTSSVADVFPQVSLGFAQGAELTLGPQDYLIYNGLMNDGSQMWCMGFRRNLQNDQPTILGENLLRNKFFVYDLAGQRIGWTDYDCSAAFNVSTSRASALRSSVPVEFFLWTLFVCFFLNFV